jgi:subtilisin family serine protease
MKKMFKVWVILVAAGLLPWLLAQAAAGQPSAAPSDKIAPWVWEHTAGGAQAEFLVVLQQQADLNRAESLSTKLEKGRYVYRTLWDTAQTTQAPLIAWLKARGVEYRSYYIVNLIWVKADRDVALDLAARSDVARLVGNPQIRALPPRPIGPAAPDRSAAPDAVEPNITYVNAPQVWAMGYTGQGIVVGGQDTGYQWDHPALKNHYRGWNGSTASHDYNWHDSIHSGGGSCGANSPAPCDDNSHGTHTMGTAVGDDGGTNQIGMAPGAKWIGCRNMNQGAGTPATYLECFEFFLAPYPVGGTPAQGNPALAPDVTNNSWGCPTSEGCDVNSLTLAVQAQRAAGIMTVVSAGNDGPACSTITDPPSFYAEVYSVGALNTGTDTIASFSSRGPVTVDGSNRRKPDISAPGTSIRSSVPGSSYQSAGWSGTSMAGPHVAGAVALLWSAHPWLKNQIAATENLLNNSAVHVSSSACSSSGWPNNTYGYGRLNVKAAVDAAQPLSVLQGSVTNKQSAAPIAGAQVAAALAAHSYTTTTNASGLYSLGVPSGTYTITASALGYMPYITTGVKITANQTLTLNIALEVTPTYVITGFVRDVYTQQPLGAQISLSGTGQTVNTNPATGYYALTAQTPSGAYQLAASAAHYASQNRSISLNQNQQQDFDLTPICLLVVDDDGGQTYDTYYTSALTQLGKSYDRTTTAPELTTLAQYDGVIWLTGVSGAIDAADQAALTSYLNGGGRLFVSGQDIGQQIGASGFYHDYLHAQFQTDDTASFTLTGQAFLSGLDVIIKGAGGANNQFYPDGISARPGGVPVYQYVGSPWSGGVAYSGTHRAVYFSFGYEAINSAGQRAAVMSATLNYLGVCGAPQAPQANFEITGTLQAGAPLTFTNTSRGSPFMTYEWNFGDGLTSTLQDSYVSHTYAGGGLYTVTLTAANRYGQSVVNQLIHIAGVYRVYLPIVLK